MENNIDVRGIMANETKLAETAARKPKGGDFIKNKPYDIKPVLERISIITDSYNELTKYINLTDTSTITAAEMIAFNNIAKAYENALLTMKALI